MEKGIDASDFISSNYRKRVGHGGVAVSEDFWVGRRCRKTLMAVPLDFLLKIYAVKKGNKRNFKYYYIATNSRIYKRNKR